MVIKINGSLRPKLLNPKNKFPINPPIYKMDPTHDASSIVIFPDGKGVSSDISRAILGLAQPPHTP